MLLDPHAIDAFSDQLRSALAVGDHTAGAAAASQLSYRHTAQLLTESPRSVLRPFLEALGPDHAGRVIGELTPAFAAEFLAGLGPEQAGSLLRRVPPDQAAAILGVVDDDLREALLAHTDEAMRSRIGMLRSWGPATAGSVMSPHYLAVRMGKTIRKTMNAVQSAPPGIERASYVYVVDAHDRVQGVLSIKDLYRLRPEASVESAMAPDVIAIRAAEPAVRAARVIRNRRLTMLPVLDDEERILGVITFDDAMDLIAAEVADQFAGVGPGAREESFYTPPMDAVRMRLPWMAANVFLNLGAVFVISGFEATIAQVAILAAFLPMITDMGGNVGIQSLSVAIRSIALDDIRLRDIRRAVRKETIIGVVNGLALGALFAVIAWLLEGNPWIGALAGVALGINVLLAGTVGGCLPFVLKRLGKDPAMMTGPILTTVTDITGVTIYLGLCTLFLTQLL